MATGTTSTARNKPETPVKTDPTPPPETATPPAATTPPAETDTADPFAALTLATDTEPHPKMVEFVAKGAAEPKVEFKIPLPTRAMYADVKDGLSTAARRAGVGVSVWEWTDPESRMREEQAVKDGRSFRGVVFKVTAKRGTGGSQTR